MAEFNDMDITSANATAVLIVQDLYPNGIQLQNFSTDSAIVADAMQVTETRMGVDGHLAAGVTPNIIPVTISLEANSPSRTAMATIFEAMSQNQELYACTLTIKLKSTGETYQFSNGVMQTATALPSLNRVLAPTSWIFHFESLERVAS